MMYHFLYVCLYTISDQREPMPGRRKSIGQEMQSIAHIEALFIFNFGTFI